MTCREFADFLEAYLSGELSPEALGAFEYHLSVCVNCVRYLEQYRQSIALGRRAFEPSDAGVPDDAPEDFVRAVVSAFRLKAEATQH